MNDNDIVVRVTLDAQLPLALYGPERPPGFVYETEHQIVDEFGAVLCASTDWTVWLAAAVAYQSQGVQFQYRSRLTGRCVPSEDSAILAGGRP